MKRKITSTTLATGLSGMLLAAGAYGAAATAGELNVHYDRSAVPAVELTGPQVARPDHLREVEFAAIEVEPDARIAPRLTMEEIHYDRSAAPVTEWVGPQVAWPDEVRAAEFAAFEPELTPKLTPQDIHYDRSAVPATELTGPQVARPHPMR
jgi:hypothetical protein